MSADPSALPSSLLPAPLRRPLWLLGTLVVPQLVLLLLNFRAWWLVAGELTPLQTGQVQTLGASALLLIVIGLGAALTMARGRRTLDWPHGLVLLLGHAAYLWAVTASLDKLVPASVPDWMLPRGMVLYHQFALCMPALLHGALLVACFGTRRHLGVELGGSALAVFGLPLFAYGFAHLVDSLNLDRGAMVYGTILIFASLTALLVMALLRLLMLLAQLVQRLGGHGRLVLLALVGIVGPIAGLALNIKIPFPADFQSTGVYVMALLNGFALLLPVDGPRLHHRLAWLAQCALFAFTTYFMLVFLPFLPLSLLAMIAMGAGLLMLVPLVLFVLHAQQLASGWRAVRSSPDVAGWAAAGFAAFLLLPGGIALRAHQDRVALKAALDHVHSPDYAQGTFGGDLAALQRGLEHLRDFKAGLQLPFLSGFYNQVVFGGLVLPDAKLHTLYLTFFGRDLPEVRRDDLMRDVFGTGRRRGMWNGWRANPPPTNTVDLTALETTRAVEGDCETATAKLVLHNRGSVPAEFVTQLHLPPGVFVSGYWLHIGKERVPGRVFEKKAALWVYEMIRDLTRRDPGLLLYRQPGLVELRVFPLAAGETRTTEIELIWPRGLAPPVRLADRVLDTTSAKPAPGYVVADGGELGQLLIASPPRLRAAGTPAAPEPPYLHVIVDASTGTDVKKLAARATELARQAPGVREVVLTAANFECVTPQARPESLEKLDALASALTLPARGGFCRDRALKCALAWRAAHAPQRPVVLGVLVGDGPRAILPDEDLAWFAQGHPTVAGYLERGSNGVITAYDFQRELMDLDEPALLALDVAGRTVLVPRDGEAPVSLALPPGAAGGSAITNARYRKCAAAWLRYASWVQQPAGRDEERARIVEASREANVLTPLSSFIVVENSAQWRLLEEKEKQKLKHADALEIQKAPEPETWLLAAGFAAWLLARRRRRS
jgi:hypothetical protein